MSADSSSVASGLEILQCPKTFVLPHDHELTFNVYDDLYANDPATKQVKCRSCQHPLNWSKGNATSNLLLHQRTNHSKIFNLWEEKKQEAGKKRTSSAATSSCSESQRPKLQPMPSRSDVPEQLNSGPLLQLWKKQIDNDLATTFAIAFATSHLSFNILSNPDVMRMFQAMSPQTEGSTSLPIPNRNSIKAATISVADRMRQELIEILQTASSQQKAIGIAVDGWTNVNQEKITNIVFMLDGTAYYWCSIVNAFDTNSSEWLRNQIVPKLNELKDKGIRFSSFVADNENTMNCLYDLLKIEYPFLLRVPCAAHTIQLIVKGVLAMRRWTAVRAQVLLISKTFRKNKEYRDTLRRVQVAVISNNPDKKVKVLKLVKPNTTRWNSFLAASERLVLLRRFVEMSLPNAFLEEIDASFWTDLSALITFLQPFKLATDRVQRDRATLYDVFAEFNAISQHVESVEDVAVRSKARAALRERWANQSNEEANIACAILSLDVPLEKIKEEVIEKATDFIVDFGAQYLVYWEGRTDLDVLCGSLRNQLAQLKARIIKFATMDTRIKQSKAGCQAEGISWTPLLVWAQITGELSHIARVLLSIPASEAAVERTFSLQAAIHSKKRNRLHSRTVESSMFIAFNHDPMRLADSNVVNLEEEEIDDRLCEIAPEFLDSDTDVEEADMPDMHTILKQPAAAIAAAVAAATSVAAAAIAVVEESKDSESEPDELEEEKSEQRLARTKSAVTKEWIPFLAKYICQAGITSSEYRWGADTTNALECAAVQHKPGGPSSKDLITHISTMITRMSPEEIKLIAKPLLEQEEKGQAAGASTRASRR